MTYGRNLRNLALASLLLVGSACGDDDGSPADEDGGGSGRGSQEDSGGPTPTDDGGGQSGSSGDAASPDSGAGSGGSSMSTVDAGPDEDSGVEEEQCGAVSCGSPMCCADPFASMCGLRISERACLPPQMMGPPPMSDPRCPTVTFGSFMIASCCTADNRCGINAQMAGMGCVSLEQVIMFTMGMGGPGGSVMFPEPQACE